jgi:hypothetical protein
MNHAGGKETKTKARNIQSPPPSTKHQVVDLIAQLVYTRCNRLAKDPLFPDFPYANNAWLDR